jgi:hypothetical protein
VATNRYGSGQAVAFTYDLAQTVAQLRQGNPATAGTDVDGDGIVRTIEGFDVDCISRLYRFIRQT